MIPSGCESSTITATSPISPRTHSGNASSASRTAASVSSIDIILGVPSKEMAPSSACAASSRRVSEKAGPAI